MALKKKKVEVELFFNADGAVAKIRGVDGKFIKLGKTVKKTEQSTTKSFGRISADAKKFLGPFGAAGALSSTAVALGHMARAVIDTGMKFEQSMARVGALSGATSAELDLLTSKARELGATTVFSATEAAEGMQFLAMAGFNTSQIIQAMPGLLDQAAAGQIDLGRAADITSNVLSGFGLAAAESGRVADVLTKASISSNTTIEGLGQSMAFVAPVAASLGLELEELTAATGILGDAGIQATRAGTALRGSLLQLATPSRIQRELMDELGFSFTKADGSTKSLAEVVDDLQEKTKNMTAAQRTSTLAVLVGAEAASGFTTLISAGSEKLREFTEELNNSAGTAGEVAAKQIDTLSGSLRLLNSALDNLSITVFDSIKDTLQDVVEGATLKVSEFEHLLSHQIPLAFNHYLVAAGKANSAIVKFFGGSEEAVEKWRKQIEQGQEAILDLTSKVRRGENRTADDTSAPLSQTENAGGSSGDDKDKKPQDRLAQLQKEREELIKTGVVTEELVRLTSQIQKIEQERAFAREGAKISAVEAADVEVQSVDKSVAAWERRRDAVLDSAQREIEADQRRTAAKKELEQAEKDFIAQQLMSVDVSIQSGKDLANAAGDAARQAIQAQIAVLIANSLPKVGFPFNLALWPIAQAASSLALNNLIPQFATGVTNFGGGIAMVGERGPELVNLPQGSNVITNENTEKLIGAIQGSGAGAGNDFSGLMSEMRAIRDSNAELMNVIANRPAVAVMDTESADKALRRYGIKQNISGRTRNG